MKTILSVDDEEAILQCFKRALTGAGYEVITTTDAREAIATLSKEGHGIDMITLDVRMPAMNGIDAYRLIKDQTKDTLPVLFVTAYPTEFSVEGDPMAQMIQNLFIDGNTDMLYKPFDINVLIAKVQALIGPAEEESG